MNIVIIGGGSWGLALSNLLHDNGHKVKVWEYNLEYVKLIQETGYNNDFLPNIKIKASVSHSLPQVISSDLEMLILATPSTFLKQILKSINPLISNLKNIKYIINVAKGFDHSNGDILSEMIKKELPSRFSNLICVLSGPSHAEEVALKKPTTVTIAGNNLDYLYEAQKAFSNDYFRAYRTTDIIGVELGGALKNVIALAAGIVVGLGLGDNTLGALLTRGNVEIKRLSVALGAKPETLDGLAGMGDLITTAISHHSRNRYVGVELGKGRSLKDILAGMKMVAEGVSATKTTFFLAEKHGVDMPIVEATYKILQGQLSAPEAITQLMLRELKPE
ncbi:NAD(P)-dependent glycerol-3-phosphate dehydrogenase [bacterium]|nr:NAD(P)-dependent glycerol-3-phosphate dehydrogenase [bacterium]